MALSFKHSGGFLLWRYCMWTFQSNSPPFMEIAGIERSLYSHSVIAPFSWCTLSGQNNACETGLNPQTQDHRKSVSALCSSKKKKKTSHHWLPQKRKDIWYSNLLPRQWKTLGPRVQLLESRPFATASGSNTGPTVDIYAVTTICIYQLKGNNSRGRNNWWGGRHTDALGGLCCHSPYFLFIYLFSQSN